MIFSVSAFGTIVTPPRSLSLATLPLQGRVKRSAHAPSPVFFVRRRVRRYSLQRAPQTRGAERRQTRRFARPPERLRGRPRRLARRLLSVATERRLPALRLRLAPPAWPETQAPGPRFLGRGNAPVPVQQAPCSNGPGRWPARARQLSRQSMMRRRGFHRKIAGKRFHHGCADQVRA